MMNILLKNVKIEDKNSPFDKKTKDVGIIKGKITFDIKGKKFSKEYDLKGVSICPGFMDMRAFLGEPGVEYKEDLASFEQAAKRGGFTTVAIVPNTLPVLDTLDTVANVKTKSANSILNIYPIAALSKEAKGEELSEMIDLQKNGAVAFSDGHNPVYHADLILKGLQYGKNTEVTIINTPIDYNLSKKGYVNEGEVSTSLGMPGIPHIAEEIAIERDLKLVEYAGGKLHFSLLTTEKGVDLIRKAKKKGLNVTCDIAAHYLAFDDTCLSDFDANYKVFPPFRTKKDIKALLKGVKDGTIDAIVSDHRPENIENKKLEFDRASYGIASLETTFSTLCTYTDLSCEEIIHALSFAPREILAIPMPCIEEGADANISLVHFNEEIEVSIHSKSSNNPFKGQKMKGKVMGIINGDKSWIDGDR